MRTYLCLMILFLLSGFVSVCQSAVINDHFDDGVLDPAWNVIFENSTAWDYVEVGTELIVSDITIESSSFKNSRVFLSQDVILPGDFQLELSLGWDSENNDSAMQHTFLSLMNNGEIVAYGGYHDPWVGSKGEKIGAIGDDDYRSGQDSLPHSGNAIINIERVADILTIYWNDTEMISLPYSTLIDEICIEFTKQTWPTATFGSLSVDYITVIPEPGTLCLLCFGSLSFLLRRKKK